MYVINSFSAFQKEPIQFDIHVSKGLDSDIVDVIGHIQQVGCPFIMS